MANRFVRPYSNRLPGAKLFYSYQVLDETAEKYLIKNEHGQEEWHDKADLYPYVSESTLLMLLFVCLPLIFFAWFFPYIFEIYYPSGFHYYLDSVKARSLTLAALFLVLIPYASAIFIFISWGEISTRLTTLLIRITKKRLLAFGVIWAMLYTGTVTSGIATLNSNGLTLTPNLFSLTTLSWDEIRKGYLEIHIFDRAYKGEIYVEYTMKLAGIDLAKQSTEKHRSDAYSTSYTDATVKLLIENKMPLKYSITPKAEELLKNPATVKYKWQSDDIHRMLNVMYSAYQKIDPDKANQFKRTTNGLL